MTTLNDESRDHASKTQTPPKTHWKTWKLEDVQAAVSVGGDLLTKTIWELVQRVNALENTRREPHATKSWAQVAAPRKPVQSSATKKTEVIIVPDEREPEIKGRRGSATYRAVKALVGNAVDAARRLPDGSTALRIAPSQEGNILEERAWIPVVFGKKARVAKGGLQVLIKGIPTATLDAITTEDMVKQCNALQCTKKAGKGGYGTILCKIPNLERARQMTKEGIKLGDRTFRCEPFCNQGKARQCFNCLKWGHIARQCRDRARCGRCAKAKHPGECQGTQCINCRGAHPSLARDICPVAQEHWEAANRVFRDRPRSFPAPTPRPSATGVPTPTPRRELAPTLADELTPATHTTKETPVPAKDGRTEKASETTQDTIEAISDDDEPGATTIEEPARKQPRAPRTTTSTTTDVGGRKLRGPKDRRLTPKAMAALAETRTGTPTQNHE